jgi:hypothetical protein
MLGLHFDFTNRRDTELHAIPMQSYAENEEEHS